MDNSVPPAEQTPSELINLTCISGPSKPPARLTWLLNDLPLLELDQLARKLPGQSRPLVSVASERGEQLATGSGSLQEARSTLQLNSMQPSLSYLLGALLQRTRPAEGREHSLEDSSTSTTTTLANNLRITCLARIQLEFRAETRVIVSAAAAAAETTSSAAPTSGPDESPRRPPAGGDLAALTAVEYQRPTASPFRWPPNAGRARAEPDQSGGASRRAQVQRPGGLVVWTGRQLRAQTEQIERLLRLARPSELEAPVIGAKTVGAGKGAQAESGERISEDNSEGGESSEAGSGEDVGPTTEEDNEQMDPTSEPNILHSSPLAQQTGGSPNELVQFTCTTQLSGGGVGAEVAATGGQLRQMLEQLRRVKLEWLINDVPVELAKVNHFDGGKFTLVKLHDNSNQWPSTTVSGNSSRGKEAREQLVSVTHMSWTGAPRGRLVGRQRWARQLLVELTPELLKLKELRLKCRTLVEQPLIEFESQWDTAATRGQQQQQQVAAPPTNSQSPSPPNHYVQSASRESSPGAKSYFRHYTSSAARSASPSGNERAGPGQTGSPARRGQNVIRMRQSSSGASTSSFALSPSIWLALALLQTLGGGGGLQWWAGRPLESRSIE